MVMCQRLIILKYFNVVGVNPSIKCRYLFLVIFSDIYAKIHKQRVPACVCMCVREIFYVCARMCACLCEFVGVGVCVCLRSRVVVCICVSTRVYV